MVTREIAEIFDRMARTLAFKGKNRFRALAYERAAVSLKSLDQDLTSLASKKELEQIPGIGHDLAEMIEEYIETGRIRRCELEMRSVSDELLEMMDIPGLGPKTLALLHKKFRIKNVNDLSRLIEKGSLVELRGFGEKKIENLRRGIELHQSGKQRGRLGTVLPTAEKLLDEARKIKLVERADLAGSIRRRRETIGDIDLLISSRKGNEALREFVKLPLIKQVTALGPTRASVIIEGGLQVDVRAVPKESYGAALHYFTGSKQHSVHLRTLAQARGLKINEYGVFRGDERIGGEKEEDAYRALGMEMPPPELREDRGEIDAAMEAQLPKLIEEGDLRGDLHAHTTWSDGRSSLEEMITAAAAMGLEYIAITDHSPSSRIAHGLDLKRLERKIEEVEALRKKRGRRKPRILMGAEVDILADGRLDYPDEVLARLDVVVASVHGAFRQSKDKMTGRLLDAIANPYTHIIGHPTTRLIGSREPVEFDFERIVEAAARAGVALEVNGSPSRLDLNDVLARAANEAGALLAIDSDAHSAAQLEQTRYGVFQARRGWVEARSVVNAWPWPKFNRWLRHRREAL
ncbi:MAG TPA: DNA polymerase/3'-5' exonuclease PolX [Blastocatellia bacterium]|nr:DNA polymerase/3'-5' exonuclease PolX [Blastocatellia bacterium]